MFHQNLKIALLSILIAFGLAAKAQALSVLPIYSAIEHDGTMWAVTHIDGELIDAASAPMLHFNDGRVFVSQGCRSFTVTGNNYSEVTISFIQTLVACDAITPRETRLIEIFEQHIGYMPVSTEEQEMFDVVFLTGAPGLRAVKIELQAKSITGLPLYQAADYEDSTWIITEIDGAEIAQNEAPRMQFSDGMLFIHQGCRSLSVTGTMNTDLRLETIETTAPCDPMTPQETRIMEVFKQHIGFSPYNSAGTTRVVVVNSAGQYPILAETFEFDPSLLLCASQ